MRSREKLDEICRRAGRDCPLLLVGPMDCPLAAANSGVYWDDPLASYGYIYLVRLICQTPKQTGLQSIYIIYIYIYSLFIYI